MVLKDDPAFKLVTLIVLPKNRKNRIEEKNRGAELKE